jgi:hypothetical protein
MTNNHASYGWNFGDGSPFELTTSGSSWHTYTHTGRGTQTHDVGIVGFKAGGGIDNIISCTVTFEEGRAGGDPVTYSGTCS